MAINFLGVGSGLELQSMMDQLVALATKPKVEQLGKQEAKVNSSISGLGEIKSVLSDLQSAADALKSSGVYNNRTATTTQPTGGDVISVTADSTATDGNYDISVEAMATGSRLQSTAQYADLTAAQSKSGVLSFGAGASSFDITVDLTDSISDIKDKINSASDNFGVTATIVDGYLVYKSSVTGTGNSLNVTNDNDSLDDLSTDAGGVGVAGVNVVDSATDAEIIVDGITITNSTNTFEGSVSGLSITALKADPGQTASTTVAMDTQSVASKVSNFALAYNDVIEKIQELHGSNDEEGNFVPGPMFGDPLIRQIESYLGGVVSSAVPGADSSLNSMYAVGFDLQDDGTISVDNDRLSAALTDNFELFDELFSGDGGFGTLVSVRLETYLEYGGIISTTEDGYQDSLDRIEEQYKKHIEYVTSYKETLQKQFSSLDATMATLQATMNYVQNQLAALNG